MKTTTKKSMIDTEDFSSRIQTASMHDLFINQLREIYDAELKFLRIFPEVIETTTSRELKNIFGSHLESSRNHIKRLEEIFAVFNLKQEIRECLPVFGYVEEFESLTRTTTHTTTRDMALISVVQKVEHFEIAAYDNLQIMARILGYTQVSDLLKATLDEEEEMEETLSALAESCIIADADTEYIAYND
jgi:ferritin-like metal-binding protein YciE